MLDLSKGGRIRRGGKSWPETVHCRNYITTHFQIYFEYEVFRGYYNLCFQNSKCFSSSFCWTHPLKTYNYCTLENFAHHTLTSRCLSRNNNWIVTYGYHCFCNYVSIAYITMELCGIPIWLHVLWRCSVFASRAPTWGSAAPGRVKKCRPPGAQPGFF